jgi:hypothetical protein
MRPCTLFIVLGGLLLAAAVCLQFGFRFQENPVARPPHLRQSIPETLGSWMVSDEQLGPSEAASASAVKTLNLDEYVYRAYTKGSTRFTIYAAYWAPGRMPTRLVASHTPDRCWTEIGLRCTDMKFKLPVSVGDRALLPAEWRIFAAPGGEVTHVMYWHLVEGELYDYGYRFNAIPNPWLWWKDTVSHAMKGSREQYFIRVTANIPFDQLRGDAGFETALSSMGGLALQALPAGKKS